MLHSVQDPIAAGPQRRHSVVAILFAVTLGVSTLALWQQFQLRQLSSGNGVNVADTRTPMVRRISGPRIVMAPYRSIRPLVDGRANSRLAGADRDRPAYTMGPGTPNDAPTSVMEDPEFVRAFELYRQGLLDARYADLFRRLNLSPGELASFKHLLTEKDNMALDVVAVSQNEGPLTPDALRAGIRTAQGDVENSIHAALGDERYDEYRSYEDTLAQRETVVQLERRLSYTSTPLSAPQAESLVKILAQNSPASSPATVPGVSLVVGTGTNGVMPVINPDATGLVTDEAISQAQGLLSPQQVAALRQLQVEQQAILEASRMIIDGSQSQQVPQVNWGLLLQ